MTTFTQKLTGSRWHTRAEVSPGATLRIPLVVGSPCWTLFAKNFASVGAPAQLFATLSGVDEARPVEVRLAVSPDGTLAAGADGQVGQQTPVLAIIVIVAADADDAVVVEVLQ